VVNDLRKFIEAGAEKDASGKSLKWKEETISLDENRDYSELWTQKSLRNKEAYSAMIGESPLNEVDGCSVKTEASSLKGKLPKPPERVSFSQLSKFLFDPFQFRVNQMLKSDDEENVEKELFEPISFDALDSSIVLKKMLVEALSKDEKESDVKSDLKKIGKMPDGNYEKKQWEFLENERKSLLEQIEKTPDLVNSIKENWSYGEKIQNLSFETDGVRWVLTGSLDWCNNKELKKVDEFIEITTSDSVRSERWLSAYVKSLALIALKDDEAEKTIKVDFYCSKAKKPKKATVSTTPENARKMLCNIYRMAFVGEKGKVFGKAVPYEMLNSFKEEIENPPRNSKGLIYEFRDQLIKGPWANFDKKDLFDPVQDVGFNPETFLEEWKQSVKKMADMVPNNKPRA
jgi:exodeoxyribonuclease V gamma subunit